MGETWRHARFHLSYSSYVHHVRSNCKGDLYTNSSINRTAFFYMGGEKVLTVYLSPVYPIQGEGMGYVPPLQKNAYKIEIL